MTGKRATAGPAQNALEPPDARPRHDTDTQALPGTLAAARLPAEWCRERAQAYLETAHLRAARTPRPRTRSTVLGIDTALFELTALCHLVIEDPASAVLVARLVNHPLTDPAGAFVLAALCHLATDTDDISVRRPLADGAQFWWRFAAGADDLPSTHALALLAEGHGHMDEARLWTTRARQAAGDRDVRTVVLSAFNGVPTTPTDSALCPGVRHALAGLRTGRDPDFGRIPRIDPYPLAQALQRHHTDDRCHTD